jgi:acetylornithine deacetylase/succinyl-diaminopimelate desuccinylase-like protein
MNVKRASALFLSWATCVCAAVADAPARSATDLKAREIYAKVISIPSQLGNAKVPEVAEYLAGEFRAAGFPDRDIQILPFKGTGDATASLVVRFRSNGKGVMVKQKPILLIAHMDVVAAKRDDWQRDPYTLIEENGFFYGRGTYDDKQGVVALTATFLRLKAEKFMPRRDLIIYFSGDEETAQATAADTAKNHRELIDAEYALNADAGNGALDEKTGEPLYYSFQTAEKTYADFTLTARNPGGHSSLPRADNAIYDLAAALGRLREYKLPVRWNDTTIASLRLAGKREPGELGKVLTRFAMNPADEEAAERLAREPAYIGQTRTTCVPTMLIGGHATNALPQSATANVNCRIFPGETIDEVRQALQGVAGAGLEVKVVGEPMWSDASPLRSDVVGAVSKAVRLIHPDVPVVPGQGAGATDGLVFRSIGIPTYGVDGNFMKASDDFSHGLNERLSVQSFYDSLTYWHALLTDLASSHER